MAIKILFLFLLAACPALAQIRIENPKRLPVPEEKAQVIFSTACRVVAEEFHVPHSQLEFPLVLVLGEENQRYTADEGTGTYTVYLRQWDPVQFADSAMRLAVQRLVPPQRRNRMLTAILYRSREIAPISVEEVRKGVGHSQPPASTTALAKGALPRP